MFLADAEFENGHTLDHDGSIVACSHGHRRLERLSLDGTLDPDRRPLPGHALQLPQRRRREVRRHHLVHGPALRHHEQPRGPRGSVRDRRLPRVPVRPPHGRARRRHRLARGAERPRLLAGRDRPLRLGHVARLPRRRRRQPPHRGVRCGRRPEPREPAGVLQRRRLGGGRLPGRRRGQRLDVRATTASTWSPRTGGGWAGCRSPSERRTASSAAPISIACSSPRRRRSTRSTWPPEASSRRAGDEPCDTARRRSSRRARGPRGDGQRDGRHPPTRRLDGRRHQSVRAGSRGSRGGRHPDGRHRGGDPGFGDRDRAEPPGRSGGPGGARRSRRPGRTRGWRTHRRRHHDALPDGRPGHPSGHGIGRDRLPGRPGVGWAAGGPGRHAVGDGRR